ncbi:hypothetical protein H2200_004122 [Cladophialophora chaetospira]|uniref:FCP1 homology domain-containing protein n=1 Tax=Cladophialophora chaetospira TaxID=386627 RepID=A0AA38XFJ0_9EURO|nr:hypothetical protein H2200_004122 [Cladophialophora chaetospira]
MTRTKQAAQRGTGGKLFPRRPRPSDQSAEPSPRRPPSQQPENETTNSTSTSDRLAQIQQGDYSDHYYWYWQNRIDIYAAVDSWRSYRDDTTNLQTATGSESPYSPPLPFGTSQQQVRPLGSQIQAQEMSSPPPLGQQVYPPPLQTMDPTALSFRSSTSTEHSHFTPYQPLRVSNGVAERQRIQLATNASQSLPQVQPQSQAQWQPPVQPQYQAQAQWQLSVQPQGHAQGQTHGQNQLPDRYRLRPRPEAFRSPLPETRRTRYPLRQRTDEQTAPYSTGVADQILSSVETWGASSRFIPHARRASSRPLSTVETSGNTSPQYIPQVQGASPRPNWNKEVPGPAAPTPTKEYKRDAEFDPVVRPEPQKLLVVLDLNGTLLVRPNKRKPQNIIVRPGVPALLDYLFRNHVVMIYSSAKPQNCAAMIDKFFLPDQRAILAAVWARDKLGLTQIQYDSKVQVYKKLEPIWQDQRIQNRAEPGKRWDHSNTVLVDDSQLKALAQPHNLLQVPEFLNNEPTDGIQAKLDWRRGEEAIVHSVQQKLEQLKWQVSVTRLIREWQTGKRQAPGVVDETVDQNALHREGGVPSPSPAPSMGDREPSHEPQQLQTPRDSPMSGVEEDRPQYVPVEVQSDDGVSSGDEGGATLNGLEAQIDRNLSLHQSPPDRNMDQNRQTAGAATGVGAVATTKMLGRKRPKNIKVGTPEYSAWIQARKKYRNDHKAEIKAERKKKRQAKDTAFKVAKVVRQRLHQQQQVTPSAKETRKMVAQAMQKMTLRD